MSRPSPERGALEVRGMRLPWGERTYVMGIVNVTPDSFSGDGVLAPGDALGRALAQLRRGSDIVDV
ncbi:MAG TPA: dihydropteroate synthase, partial [Candidatus Baltobacteraceae bacterium]